MTVAEIRAQMPAEARARLDAIAGQDVAQRRAGGPWRLYLPLPASRTMRLHWSYATREQAELALVPMYPVIRKRAEIRYEV